MYLHHVVHPFDLKLDQLDFSAIEEKAHVFDNISDVFLSTFGRTSPSYKVLLASLTRNCSKTNLLRNTFYMFDFYN